MEREVSITSARNAYYVAMAVAVLLLVRQVVQLGGYDSELFAVVVVSQVGYWGSVLYYRRTGEVSLPLVEE